MERSSSTEKPTQTILLVDDDAGAIQLIGAILGKVATLRFATNGRDALRLAREVVPDLILLDAEMPGMSGFELLGMLKAEPQLADVPAIFITGHTEAGFEVSALEMGAADFIAKPFRSSLVLARVKTHLRMKRLADELRHAATTDSLTGVWNRRYFDEALDREWLRGRRSSDPLSLLLIDVDHFKLYNDRYGHQQGDECLRQVAQALRSACLRPADLVARYGGEEFMMLLPQTPRRGAEQIGARVLDRVKSLGICHEDSLPNHHVSVSIGIACHDAIADACGAGNHCDCSATQLVLAADRALYAAKRGGRGRAILRDLNDVSPHEPSILVPRAMHRSDTKASSGYRQHPWSSRTTR
jgi:diguanylate cyclase (GGDEF)-like protein